MSSFLESDNPAALLPSQKLEIPPHAGLDSAFGGGEDWNKVRARLLDLHAEARSDVFNVTHYGVVGDDATDNAARLAAAAAAATASGGVLYFPRGVYCTSVPLELPHNVSVRGTERSYLKATAAMPALVRTPLSTLSEDRGVSDIALMCAGLAEVGLDVRYARYFRVDNVRVEDYAVAAYRLGDTLAPGTSYEGMVTNLRCHRQSAAVPAGSIGLHLRNATDCMVSDCVLIGAETGVKVETGGNLLANVHPWVRASTGSMLVGFEDTSSDTAYVNCYADTPSQYGWLLKGNNARLVNCMHFNGPEGGQDDIAVSVRFEHASPTGCVTGFWARGGSSSLRILKDFEFAGVSSGVSILGSQGQNVSTREISKMANPLRLEGSLEIGGGSTITKHLTATRAWDPASVASGGFTSTTNTVGGAVVGDMATASFAPFSGSVPAGVFFVANITAANTATLAMVNLSGAPVDLGNGTLRVDVWRH